MIERKTKISDRNLKRATQAIERVAQDKTVSDEALYVYAVCALIADSDGVFLEDDLIAAVNDPIIGAMAGGAVRAMRGD